MSVAATCGSIDNAVLTTLDRSLCWQVTARCNIDCPHCLSRHSEEKYELSTEDAFQVVGVAKSSGIHKMTFSGGEPLLRPDMMRLISYVLDSGLGCCLSTNGVLLDNAWIEFLRGTGVRLRISLDGPEDVHNVTRLSHDYAAAVDAIRRAVAARINIEINTVLTTALIGRLDEWLDTVVSLGVKHLNLFTFIKRVESASSTGLEVNDEQLRLTQNVVKEYQNRCAAALSVRINDYRAASRQKLIVEPDGRLVGYSNTPSNDRIYGSVLADGVLVEALESSTPQDAIDLES